MLMKALIKKKSKTKRKRRWRITSLYSNRGLYGGTMLLNDLQKESGDYFKNCCGMSYETFKSVSLPVEIPEPAADRPGKNFQVDDRRSGTNSGNLQVEGGNEFFCDVVFEVDFPRTSTVEKQIFKNTI